MQPNPLQFLALPIVGTDLVAIFRNGDISSPKYITYAKFLELIKAQITLGANFITSVGNTASINLSVISGNLTANLTNVGTAGTYGDALNVPQFTVDAQGRVTGVTLVPIAAGSGTVSSVGISGGEFVITGSPITTSGVINLALQPTGVSAGTYGSATQIPVVTVDSKGRITSITTASISGGSGTVTSVGLTVPSPANPAFSVIGSPITTSGTFQIQANGTTAQYIRGDGSLATFPTIPSGTVTSVSASVPSPSSPFLSVAVPNPTTTPAINITANGNTSQYVRGDGSLATFPNVPSNALIYPYTRRQYFNTGDTRAVGYFQDKIFVANNTGNNVRVFDATTTQILSTTTINLANTSQIIDDLAVPEHWCTTTGSAVIARHNAVTGAFIASTTPTGVVTNAQQSRFASFSSTKSIGTNLTNVYTINPNTFVTANLSAHGLGGLMTYLAINKNPSSLQNGLAMVGGQNGIILFNCTTNAIVLAATNLGGVIGNVLEIVYDSGNDYWYVASLVGGALRIAALQPASATTFTLVYNITTASSSDFTLTGGNAKQVSIVPIPALGQVYVCVNRLSFLYSSATGAIIKSNFYFDNPGTVRPTYALLDVPNKRFFFCTGGGTGALIYELIYDVQ